MATHTETQQIVLAMLPKVTASLSLAGSIWIFIEVTTNSLKRVQVYHRILLAMAVYDILESVWNVASTWPIPEGTENVYNPIGTTATCSLQGFFLQFSLGIPIYNAWLSVYYYFLIGRGMTEEQIKHSHWEYTIHLSVFAVAFTTAFSSAVMGLLNNANLWCWIASLPLGCDTDPNVPCERGDKAYIYRWAFYFAPLWTCIVVAILFVAAIYVKVKRLENGTSTQQSPQTTVPPSPGNSSISTPRRFHPYDSSVVEEDEDMNDAEQEHAPEHHATMEDGTSRVSKMTSTQQVMSQCLWYLFAFYATHLFSTTSRILQLTRDSTPFPVLVLHSIFDPLQGLTNFLVYRRPIYMRYRRLRPDLPRWKCWMLAMRFHFMFDAEKERTRIMISKQHKRHEKVQQQQEQQIEAREPPRSLLGTSSGAPLEKVVEAEEEEEKGSSSEAVGENVSKNSEQTRNSSVLSRGGSRLSTMSWGGIGFASSQGASTVDVPTQQILGGVEPNSEPSTEDKEPHTRGLGREVSQGWAAAELAFSSNSGHYESYMAPETIAETGETSEGSTSSNAEPGLPPSRTTSQMEETREAISPKTEGQETTGPTEAFQDEG